MAQRASAWTSSGQCSCPLKKIGIAAEVPKASTQPLAVKVESLSESGPFRRIAARLPVDEAVAQVAELIWSGELRAGDRMPAERTLSEWLGISRPTLRGAVRRLEQAGLLAVSLGRAGVKVKSDLVPLELLVDMPQLSRSEISGLLEARRALEPRVAQLAGLHGIPEDFDHLFKLVAEQRSAPADWDLHCQLDTRFHLAIARATHSVTTYSLMRELQRRLAVARTHFLRSPQDPKLLADIHEATARAIESRDMARIDSEMLGHLGWLERVWERESGMPRLRSAPDFLASAAESPRAATRRRRASSA